MVKKLATLVGCNYTNTPNQLNGCINDVRNMRAVLIDRFGFQPEDIELLTDETDSLIQPTGANIKRVLGHMIDLAEPGDILFFHFSGHGTLIPLTGDGPRKCDEAIVPCDFNLITDIDFRRLVNRLPKGAIFTFFSDSCHSGSLIDKEKEQIGPHSSDRVLRPNDVPNGRPKFLFFDSIIDYLRSHFSVTGDFNIHVHFKAAFENEASNKFLPQGFPSRQLKLVGPDNGILFSGCQQDERSLDIPKSDGSEAYGAFSNAVLQVLNTHQAPISNRELVTLVRKKFRAEGITQHPCLYCIDENANLPFLSETARPNA